MSVAHVNISKFLCLINLISYAAKYLKNCHLHISQISHSAYGFMNKVSIL